MTEENNAVFRMQDHLHNLWQEILDAMESESLFSKEQFYDIIDEILENHRAEGYITDDEDIEYLRSALRARWGEIERKL
jgi:ribosomal protein S8